MRPIALACLLGLGCVHIPDGPAGNSLRARRGAAISLLVGSHVSAAVGGALLGAAASQPSCRGYDCPVDYSLPETLVGWTLVAFGIGQLVVAGIFGASLLQPPPTDPWAARIQ